MTHNQQSRTLTCLRASLALFDRRSSPTWQQCRHVQTECAPQLVFSQYLVTEVQMYSHALVVPPVARMTYYQSAEAAQQHKEPDSAPML